MSRTDGDVGRALVSSRCKGVCFESSLYVRGFSKLRAIVHKFAAIAALVALLLPGVSSLAESLSAGDLPACCNTAYCPLHHRQMSEVQRDRSECGAMGVPGQRDCSMRACDSAPSPAFGTALLILVMLVSLRAPAVTEAAIALASQYFPSIVAIPLTPPPQTLPS